MEMPGEMLNSHDKDKKFIESAKTFLFKNNSVLVFSILAVLSLLMFVFRTFDILNSNSLVGLFAGYIWLVLSMALVASSILAYYEKYTLMFIPLLIWLIFTTAVIRTSNIPFLKNAATGEPVLGPDLDPFLFLRNAIEINEGRNLGELDEMRYAPLGASSYIHNSLMPWAIFGVYKFLNIFSDYTLTEAAIISPVIFFLASLIGFFLFSFTLFSFKLSREGSLIAAAIGSFLYAFIPSMLHRTVAGIPELESLGMVWFWLAFLFFILAWKQNTKNKIILYGLLSGVMTGLMSWSWGGYRYIHMTLGLAALLCFLFDIERRKNIFIFLSFSIPAVLAELIRLGNLQSIASNLSGTGFSLAVSFIMIAHLILFETKLRDKLRLSKLNLPPTITSVIAAAVVAILGLLLLKPSVLTNIFSQIVERLIYPFGRGRVGLTVAENRAPYFVEVFSSFGYLFWLFFFGVVLLFSDSVKHFISKNKLYLNGFFVLFLLGFIFSRISPSNAVLNGETLFSKVIYLGSLIAFAIVVFSVYIKAYIKKDERTLSDFKKIKFTYFLLLSFAFWAIVSMRGAVRLFFIIGPMIILIASYLPVRVYESQKLRNSSKGVVLAVIAVFVLIFGQVAISYANTTTLSARQTVPSTYNHQWHKAMNWVSENTPENSIFVHWWDYGYWVQTLGGRPTVTDGGHANEWWDHTTARYLLTTSKPETALSLMKTHNVSYLLIDSTDLGKYSAFSSIGSDPSGQDRYSWIPVMPADLSQAKETKNGALRVFQGGSYLDKDINYELNGTRVFLPQGNAAIGGLLIEFEGENFSALQPIGGFFYNNQRIDLPIRYLYYNDRLYDFGSGINATIVIVPAIVQGSQGVQIERIGAAVYLSEKTMDSLFAELYLLDDPDNKYPSLILSHVQDDPVVESLKQQGADFGEFIYYQELRGPIKIWEVSYPDNILTHKEFLEFTAPEDRWGSLDNLKFSE